MVVVTTEFGRTVRINGTAGADHGVGALALLAGGAVKGGAASMTGRASPMKSSTRNATSPRRPICRAVLKGVLAEHFEAPEKILATNVFPTARRQSRSPGWRRRRDS